MAGRGRRLGGYGEKDGPMRRPGEAVVSHPNADNINIKALIEKISKISATNIDPILMHEIEILLKQLCITGESVKDVLLNLHCKALSDSDFGEKLAIALEPVVTFEVDGTCVRSELLSFIENDYRMKDTMSQSDTQKFVNAVMFLGGIYNVIKIKGVPIKILGGALLDYIDLLLQGDEEQLRALTIQILINGDKLSASEDSARRYELLKHSLRKTLVQRSLSNKSRCWILLALDCMSSNLKPLSGVVRDFYLENIGDDYLRLESLIANSNPSRNPVNQIPSPGIVKNQVLQAAKTETVIKKENKNEELFQDIESLNIHEEKKATGKNPVFRGGDSSFKSESGDGMIRSRRRDENKSKAGKVGVYIKKNFDISQVDEDDWYGIQIEREKFVKSPAKNKINQKDHTNDCTPESSKQLSNSAEEPIHSKEESAEA